MHVSSIYPLSYINQSQNQTKKQIFKSHKSNRKTKSITYKIKNVHRFFKECWKADNKSLWSSFQKLLNRGMMSSIMKSFVSPDFSIGILWSFLGTVWMKMKGSWFMNTCLTKAWTYSYLVSLFRHDLWSKQKVCYLCINIVILCLQMKPKKYNAWMASALLHYRWGC